MFNLATEVLQIYFCFESLNAVESGKIISSNIGLVSLSIIKS